MRPLPSRGIACLNDLGSVSVAVWNIDRPHPPIVYSIPLCLMKSDDDGTPDGSDKSKVWRHSGHKCRADYSCCSVHWGSSISSLRCLIGKQCWPVSSPAIELLPPPVTGSRSLTPTRQRRGMETIARRGGRRIPFHQIGWIDLGQPNTQCPRTA